MIDLPMAPLVPNARMQGDEEQMAAGIGYCHTQIKKVANQTFVAAAEVAALARILQARGLLTEEEFLSHREAEGKRLEKIYQDQRIGIEVEERTPDKYAIDASTLPQVDCEARYHQCHGACCAMHFWLTVQDLEEGVVRWDLGRPYIIRQGSDGRCVHQDRGTLRCSVYDQRPGICRVFTCREDKRIWQDFEARIINPDLIKYDEKGQIRFNFKKEDEAGSEKTDGMMVAGPAVQ